MCDTQVSPGRRWFATRRDAFALSGTLALGIVLRGQAVSAPQFEVKAGSDLGPDHPSVVRMTEMWAAIGRESGGRIHGRVFPDNQLGSMASMLTQLRAGAIQSLVLGGSNLAPVVPIADISNLGYAGKDAEEVLRVMDGPLGEYVRSEALARGIYAFSPMWDGGMYQLGLTPRPVRAPEDLHGLKIRCATSKIAVELLHTLGAVPSPIIITEAYSGLQTKLIDGESAPLVLIETSRLFEVNKYISLTNHAWSGEWLIANGDFWKSLPADLQAICDRNARKYALLGRRDTKQMSVALVDKLARQGLTINRVDAAQFIPLLKPYYAQFAGVFGAKAWGLLEGSLGRKLT